MKNKGYKGERNIDGRLYILAGRGTKEFCRVEAVQHRKSWELVRIVRMSRYSWVDDYGIYVFGAK